ncbi:conserved hypothetical protein [Vibrio cholerae O395]|nr:conserved hypothetical protein [Vibrio cholerae O395]
MGKSMPIQLLLLSIPFRLDAATPSRLGIKILILK